VVNVYEARLPLSPWVRTAGRLSKIGLIPPVSNSKKSIPLSFAGLVKVTVITAEEGAIAHQARIEELDVVESCTAIICVHVVDGEEEIVGEPKVED
jgi:hypothetical protein